MSALYGWSIIGTIFQIIGVILLSLYIILGHKRILRILGKGKIGNAIRKAVDKLAKKGLRDFSTRDVEEYYQRKFVILGIIFVVTGNILNMIAIFDISFNFKLDMVGGFLFFLFLLVLISLLLFYLVPRKYWGKITTIITTIIALSTVSFAFCLHIMQVRRWSGTKCRSRWCV